MDIIKNFVRRNLNFQLRLWRKWIGLGLVFYDYDGEDDRLVTDWILHLGFVWVIKNRFGKRTWAAPNAFLLVR